MSPDPRHHRCCAPGCREFGPFGRRVLDGYRWYCPTHLPADFWRYRDGGEPRQMTGKSVPATQGRLL